MEKWTPMDGPERVSMTREEFESRIAEATEKGYHQASKSKSLEKDKGVRELSVAFAKAILLLTE